MSIQETFNIALQDHKENKLRSAEKLYKKILLLDQKHFDAIYLLGTIYFQTQKFYKAKIKFQKAFQIQPNHATLCNNFGATLIQLGEYQKAISYLQKAIQIQPNYAHAYNNFGSVLIEVEQQEKAISYLQKAIQIQPNLTDAHVNLGLAFKELGEFKKAIDSFQKAIQIQPRNIKAHQNLMESYERINKEKELKNAISNAKNFINGNAIIKLYEAIILYNNNQFTEAKNYLESISFDVGSVKNEIKRITTLAKCYDRIGDGKNAFKYFVMANNLFPKLKKKIFFDKKRYLQSIKTRKKFFSQTKVKKWKSLKSNKSTNDPIFLIGFPRSGTTLLDTILRSHPLIEVIEEKPMVKNLTDSLSKLPNGGLQDLEKINEDQLKKIRQVYFDSLESQIKKKDNSKLYIDKFPLNIIHTGEIVRIFPNSKFIVSIRHPYDCVLSCFMQNFKLNNAMANFLNLNDAAHLYDVVMHLWIQYISIFKINYHEVKYENLVKNLKSTVSSVLKFLELPWDDSVFNFPETAKKRESIATPSYNQAIKPLYSHASGRWKLYKNEISDICPILDSWVKKYNY